MTAQRIMISLALLGAATPVVAQSSSQTVSFQVDAINQIAFSGSPSLALESTRPSS